ncbi:MAG: hypothetical protein QOJ42_4051 [Acidobacteriaceae bacterium]|jgi:uncharacterized protein (DUF433 family)|nr:hypothetical protein [Acidobacteriaceae bacterium]MEA3005461.1 hypothetical protein [Acidobacteriaceae bacterium]
MDWSSCEVVEIVPGKVSGLPLIRGSRVPADQVLENHNAGESVEDIAYNFDLKPDDIRFVLIYAALSANLRKAGGLRL